MSAPQLTDPGTSSEWFRAVDETARANAAARRKHFQRLVTYTMVGLTAFAVLGLGSYAWRRHTLQAALEAPPPVAAPVVVQAASPTPAAQPALAPETVPPPPAAAAKPVAAPKAVVAKAKPAPSKKSGGAFLKAVKPQPAKMKRR
jgi:hypothetical protein